ncbi:MAG: alpha/beta fold hydrolase [Planctomycetales bacterium]|nr:alpha/beta fold hydrolase [bacterium]UNM08720.1 MAG: alpha/beta fold hydrolase [Planctomycetales bacterium]
MKKRELLKLLGDFPGKAALEPVVLAEEDKGSYIQRKVEYASEAGERISAYLLLPKHGGKLPAIFAHHQHAGNFELGKSEVVGLAGDPDQCYAKELAERGYVVIAPDAIGFEERNDTGNTGGTAYREFTARLVQGSSLNAKAVHDITAAVDYLCTLPEVDADRIGFIGHSYGGQMALWYPAFDNRIRATVSNCRCISYAESMEKDIGIQLEFAIPGIAGWGDIGDLVGLFDNCSTLISATTQDKYSFGAQALADYIRASYPTQEVELKIYEGGHVFTPEMREYAYAWLDSRLKT